MTPFKSKETKHVNWNMMTEGYTNKRTIPYCRVAALLKKLQKTLKSRVKIQCMID